MLVALISFASCEKSLEEVNIDPNNSPSAKDANILTAAQGYLGYNIDYELNGRLSTLWAQYYTWGIGVSIGNAERYVAQPNDFDNVWIRSYSSALTDLKFLTKSEDAAYRGASKVLQAYIYQYLVDHFGSIPYSEATNGAIEDGANLTPGFDDAAAIYGQLILLLDEATTDLNAAFTTSMGSDDLIYGGDIEKWKKFANSLKLRVLLRLSETGDADGEAVKAHITRGNFIENVTQTAAIPFNGDSGNQNPMYARFEFGVGDFYFASNATLNVLRDLNDPRDTIFYSRATTGGFAGQIHGIDQGTIDDEPFTAPASDYSGSSPNVYGPDQPVYLMTPWEVDFLRAEAAVRYGTTDDAETMFRSGIQKNFNFYLVGDATGYTDDLDFAGASSMDDKLDLIAVQKWISMNGSQEDEGWIEARRFDRPASRLFTDGIWQTPPLSVLPAGQFPASWLYPGVERSFNPKTPDQRTITEKIFWDN